MFPARTLSIALALVGTASAQFTITDQNATYTMPAIAAQTESVNSSFTANPVGASDTIYEHWWAIRIDNDPDEVYFNNTNLTTMAVGPHADLDWRNFNNRNLFDAELDLDVQSTGMTSGRVRSTMTIRNISPNPIVVNLYHYLDADICSAGNHTATGPGTMHNVVGACAGGDDLDVTGVGADLWTVQAFSGTECGIVGGGPATLNNMGLPFGPGDYSSAFQWRDRMISPGQSLTVVTIVDHNPNPLCGNTASATHYGVGGPGSNGRTPRFDSTPPVLGANAMLTWSNAMPGAAGVLVIGSGRVNVPIDNVTLLTVPLITIDIAANASGAGAMTVAIPAFAAACGGGAHLQAFFLDAGRTPLPLSHSDGVEVIFGS